MNNNWTIKNISEIRSTPRKPIVIHMTAKQWKHLMKKIEIEDQTNSSALDSKGIQLMIIPDPGGDVILFPVCSESEPNKKCMVKPGFSSKTGMITFECHCRDERVVIPSPPTGSGSIPKLPKCISGITNTHMPEFRCLRGSCSGNCQPVLTRIDLPFRQIIYQLRCECR